MNSIFWHELIGHSELQLKSNVRFCKSQICRHFICLYFATLHVFGFSFTLYVVRMLCIKFRHKNQLVRVRKSPWFCWQHLFLSPQTQIKIIQDLVKKTGFILIPLATVSRSKNHQIDTVNVLLKGTWWEILEDCGSFQLGSHLHTLFLLGTKNGSISKDSEQPWLPGCCWPPISPSNYFIQLENEMTGPPTCLSTFIPAYLCTLPKSLTRSSQKLFSLLQHGYFSEAISQLVAQNE